MHTLTSGARNISHRGREFYVGFYLQHPSASSTPFIHVSAHNQSANFTVYNRYFRRTSRYILPPYSSIAIAQSSSMEISSVGITSRILHILSDQDIKVVAYQKAAGTAGGSLLLPTPAYGIRYVIATYNPTINAKLLIIAYQDARLKIVFSNSVIYNRRSYNRYRPLYMYLSKGMGFHFLYKVDLTGTIIESNSPVAVIAGNQCVNIPTGTPFCDIAMEQFLPISILGRQYITSAFIGRKAASHYRIVAAYANTKVAISSISQTAELSSQGSFFEFRLAIGNVTSILCDKACLVVGYGPAFAADSVLSDPFMTAIPAVQHYDSSYMVFPPTPPTDKVYINYLQISIQESYSSGLRFNDSAIQNVSWIPAANSNYVFASIPISQGTHLLTHNDSNVNFGLVGFGWGSSMAGYGYLEGIKTNMLVRRK